VVVFSCVCSSAVGSGGGFAVHRGVHGCGRVRQPFNRRWDEKFRRMVKAEIWSKSFRLSPGGDGSSGHSERVCVHGPRLKPRIRGGLLNDQAKSSMDPSQFE
jgi:hypothetical protein